MKPGSKDIKTDILISGEELIELKRHTWLMDEAFGLNSQETDSFGNYSATLIGEKANI